MSDEGWPDPTEAMKEMGMSHFPEDSRDRRIRALEHEVRELRRKLMIALAEIEELERVNEQLGIAADPTIPPEPIEL